MAVCRAKVVAGWQSGRWAASTVGGAICGCGRGQAELAAGVVGKLACLVVDGLAGVVERQATDGPREVVAGVIAVGLEDRLTNLTLGQATIGKEQVAAKAAGWLAECVV